ncbi:hypothetical protein TWF718_010450 [Orbilia javanica]|uniref:Uncharacterized protein n=1 Tax=Orbilia javanica TaxID=47235 RepID=A0AAN8RA27_9PEZI
MLVTTSQVETNLSFAIEIEAEILPKQPLGDRNSQYSSFAASLRSRNLPAATDSDDHPASDYGGCGWWITNDSLIESFPGSTPMKSISPVRNFNDGSWRREINVFWSAMSSMFEVKKSTTCGSHIHIAPWGEGFTLQQTKTIAFACCYYEPYVISLMPQERRDHPSCKRNSRASMRISSLFQAGQMSTIARVIRGQTSTQSLIECMQGDTRYVLWNFKPLLGSGTIEFRGGRHLRGPNRTTAWITFVVLFVMLALKEDLLYKQSTYRTVNNDNAMEVQAFWEEFLSYADELGVRDDLPREFKMMSEKKAWSI